LNYLCFQTKNITEEISSLDLRLKCRGFTGKIDKLALESAESTSASVVLKNRSLLL
jgi:hypothetical protein